MNARIVVISLLIGLALGIAATYFGRQFVDPFLPEAVSNRGEGISGPVVAKRMEGDRLLVTVAAKEGAILVTFRKKLSEIDLLVEQGDTVTLDIKNYRPFVEDPGLRAVRKDQMTEPRTGRARTEQTETTKPPTRRTLPRADSLRARDIQP